MPLNGYGSPYIQNANEMVYIGLSSVSVPVLMSDSKMSTVQFGLHYMTGHILNVRDLSPS